MSIGQAWQGLAWRVGAGWCGSGVVGEEGGSVRLGLGRASAACRWGEGWRGNMGWEVG